MALSELKFYFLDLRMYVWEIKPLCILSCEQYSHGNATYFRERMKFHNIQYFIIHIIFILMLMFTIIHVYVFRKQIIFFGDTLRITYICMPVCG